MLNFAAILRFDIEYFAHNTTYNYLPSCGHVTVRTAQPGGQNKNYSRDFQ